MTESKGTTTMDESSAAISWLRSKLHTSSSRCGSMQSDLKKVQQVVFRLILMSSQLFIILNIVLVLSVIGLYESGHESKTSQSGREHEQNTSGTGACNTEQSNTNCREGED